MSWTEGIKRRFSQATICGYVDREAMQAALDEIARLTALTTLPPEPPPGYVRARVAVTVSSDGEWAADGNYSYASDHTNLRNAGYVTGDTLEWWVRDVKKPVPDNADVAMPLVEARS